MVAAGLDRDEAADMAEEARGHGLSIAAQATDLVVVSDDAIDLRHVARTSLDRAPPRSR